METYHELGDGTNVHALGVSYVICMGRHGFSDLCCDKKVKSGSFFDMMEKIQDCDPKALSNELAHKAETDKMLLVFI